MGLYLRVKARLFPAKEIQRTETRGDIVGMATSPGFIAVCKRYACVRLFRRPVSLKIMACWNISTNSSLCEQSHTKIFNIPRSIRSLYSPRPSQQQHDHCCSPPSTPSPSSSHSPNASSQSLTTRTQPTYTPAPPRPAPEY